MPIKFFGRRKEYQKQPTKSGERDSTLNKGTIKIAKAGTYQALAAPIYFIIHSISILYNKMYQVCNKLSYSTYGGLVTAFTNFRALLCMCK